MAKKKEPRQRMTAVLEPNAAGIDIGAEEIFVAVAPERCSVRTVAMESTGVYWIPLFQSLEEWGLEVYLVNAHYLKSVPGRKSGFHSPHPVDTHAPVGNGA